MLSNFTPTQPSPIKGREKKPSTFCKIIVGRYTRPLWGKGSGLCLSNPCFLPQPLPKTPANYLPGPRVALRAGGGPACKVAGLRYISLI